jgi:hypothetical protein
MESKIIEKSFMTLSKCQEPAKKNLLILDENVLHGTTGFLLICKV